MKTELAIFDLDGVIVDTAKYHYLAWKSLANELGFDFTEKDNQRLRGVSRMASLYFLLETGNVSNKFTQEEKAAFAHKKNELYKEYISKLDESEILSGAIECMNLLKNKGAKLALGTASKNSEIILNGLKLKKYFDCIADGNTVTKAKPDPEIFTFSSDKLGISPEKCVVFEDSEAGIIAAKRAGMLAVGLNNAELKDLADVYIDGLHQIEKIMDIL